MRKEGKKETRDAVMEKRKNWDNGGGFWYALLSGLEGDVVSSLEL